MFGYVLINEKALSPEAKARYQASYCGLCRRLGSLHGLLSRMTLSYDLTFLILLVPMALVLCNIFLLLFVLLEGNLISYVFSVLSAFLFVFIWDYVFPLIACFENGIFRTIGNALILSIANLPVTLVVTALTLLPLAVLIFFTELFFRSAILWLLLAFALIAKINCFFLERVFRRFIPADPEAAETEV